MKDWFEKWFDSPYYHVLYKHRNEQEAGLFLTRLISELHLAKGASILDLACGKGRHCIFLNKKGFDVTGIDISAQSIEAARKSENDTLTFFLHDMRKPFRINYFDCVLNLFTSFGYFEDTKDNEQVVNSAQQGLKRGGYFVIDFMNSSKVLHELVKEETKRIDELVFHIKRYEKNGNIYKEIVVEDQGTEHCFMERVQALKRIDLEGYMKHFGLNVLHLWGNYEGARFDEEHSDRLIIIAQKK
jgi:SAM-dependent methyltransferase